MVTKTCINLKTLKHSKPTHEKNTMELILALLCFAEFIIILILFIINRDTTFIYLKNIWLGLETDSLDKNLRIKSSILDQQKVLIKLLQKKVSETEIPGLKHYDDNPKLNTEVIGIESERNFRLMKVDVYGHWYWKSYEGWLRRPRPEWWLAKVDDRKIVIDDAPINKVMGSK
jgi:hypothetical protein